METVKKADRLKKSLTLPYVYVLGVATISSGLFLLPGIAAQEAGPAVFLCYMIAALPVIPEVYSISELGTAMPRAGGTYYFIDRSVGSLIGTIAGLGFWFAFILKSAFALIGMGAYVSLIYPHFNIVPLAVGFAVFFGAVNILGSKESAWVQVYLISGLLAILAAFIAQGLTEVQPDHFDGLFEVGAGSLLSTAGMVYISYIGITKVASAAEEIQNPERNLPRGTMLAVVTCTVVYTLGTFVMVGLVPKEELYGNLTPVALAASKMWGKWGIHLVIVGAIFAFLSVANAGILSASRYPLALSRDGILPSIFRVVNRFKTPTYSIILTVALVVLCLVLFDPKKIAKLASSIQLLMLSFICLSVIVMRESRIEEYDPGFRSPLYPWMQIAGIAFSIALISEMGSHIIAATVGFICLGTIWYFSYARKRIHRRGAIYHIFARLGTMRYEGLESELRGILKEKGAREEDPFDFVVARSHIIELDGKATFEDVVRLASSHLALRLATPAELFIEGFMQGTRIGATPVSHGVALPHMRLPNAEKPELVIVRSKMGIIVDVDDEFLGKGASESPIHAFFFLVSPESDPGQHLRILAQIADRVDDEDFMPEWLGERNEQQLKELLLRKERFLSITLRRNTPSAGLIGKMVKELDLPEGSLIAIILRQGQIIVPRGSTTLLEGDRITVIGNPKGIKELKERLWET